MTGLIETLGPIPYHRALREQFRAGDLREEWLVEYPDLFDDADATTARNQPWAHFHEWLGAVLLYTSTGYLSLAESYQFPKHERKQQIFRQLAPPEVQDAVLGRYIDEGPQCPDLVVYAPDFGDWFFCEVKGPNDSMRGEQIEFFESLALLTGQPVYVLELVEFRSP